MKFREHVKYAISIEVFNRNLVIDDRAHFRSPVFDLLCHSDVTYVKQLYCTVNISEPLDTSYHQR